MAYKIALYKNGKFVGYDTHGSGGTNTSYGAYGRAGGNKLFKKSSDASKYARATGGGSFQRKVVEVKRTYRRTGGSSLSDIFGR